MFDGLLRELGMSNKVPLREHMHRLTREAFYFIIHYLVEHFENMHDQGLWMSNIFKYVYINIRSGETIIKAKGFEIRGTKENLTDLLALVYEYNDLPFNCRGSLEYRRLTSGDDAEIMNLEKRIANRNKLDKTPHKGITCDECGEAPIIGVRWKCKQCSSSSKTFDLCERCFGPSYHKNDHNFERIFPSEQVELQRNLISANGDSYDDSANITDENEKTETSPSRVVNTNSFNESRIDIEEQTPAPNTFSFQFQRSADLDKEMDEDGLVKIACGKPIQYNFESIYTSNATVYIVNLGTNKIAVKVITFKDLEDEKKAVKEASKTFSHENIVKIYDSFKFTSHEAKMFIAMECGLHDCTRIERISKPSLYIELLCWQILKQVISALQYMYEDGKHIHRDIKPGNILVKEWDIKIKSKAYIHTLLCDFGLTRSENTITMSGIGAGTCGYIAPELGKGAAPSRESDIFALGKSILKFEKNIPKHTQLIQLVAKMTDEDPSNRPSHEYILRQPMFNAILTESIENLPVGSVVPILNKRRGQLNYNNEWHDLNKFIFPSCSVKFISNYPQDFVKGLCCLLQNYRKEYVAYSDTEQFEVIDVEMDHIITSKGVIYWKLVEVVA